MTKKDTTSKPKNRIREIRLSKDMTLEDLEELSEINKKTIAKHETGYSSVNLQQIEKYAEALNVSPGDLMPPEWVASNDNFNPELLKEALLYMFENSKKYTHLDDEIKSRIFIKVLDDCMIDKIRSPQAIKDRLAKSLDFTGDILPKRR